MGEARSEVTRMALDYSARQFMNWPYFRVNFVSR